VTLTRQSTVCRPFGNIRFINKADCERYRDDRGQRELHAQHLSGFHDSQSKRSARQATPGRADEAKALAAKVVTSQLQLGRVRRYILVSAAGFLDSSLIAIRKFGMSPQLDGKSSLDASTNGKATLTTSRRSFIAAGWNLCAGVALGLCVRSSWARAAAPTPVPCSRDWLWHPSDYRFESATAATKWGGESVAQRLSIIVPHDSEGSAEASVEGSAHLVLGAWVS
jgi:hypothetical protein